MIRGRRLDSRLGTVLGAREPRTLGRFYAELLGWELNANEDAWVTLGMPGHPFNLAVQLEPHHEPPVWPGEAGAPGMQLHLDIEVDDLTGATEDAVALGARLAEFQPQSNVRVLLDPEGHPFCLYEG